MAGAEPASFDLKTIAEELDGAPMFSPYPLALSAAIVNDTLRMAGMLPIADERWPSWRRKGGAAWEARLGVVAHALAHSSLRAASVATLMAVQPPFAKALVRFFAHVEPLTPEMMRANVMRREEWLRRWVEACGGRVRGESAARQRRRLERLDYRRTLAEYESAEKARAAEAKRRAAKLAEAERRATAARGWRE